MVTSNAGSGDEDSRFPCRFPAKPSINPEWHEQAYDITVLFGMGEVAEKIFPGFPCAARNGRGGVAPVGATPRRSCRRLDSQGPITPRIVAVQPGPIRRRGVLSTRLLHLRNCPGLVRLHRRTDPCGGWIKSLRDYVTASPSGYGRGPRALRRTMSRSHGRKRAQPCRLCDEDL